jgi:hypothetical protein
VESSSRSTTIRKPVNASTARAESADYM